MRQRDFCTDWFGAEMRWRNFAQHWCLSQVRNSFLNFTTEGLAEYHQHDSRAN
jgi:hypothetical protein